MNVKEPHAALLECSITNDDDKSPSPFKETLRVFPWMLEPSKIRFCLFIQRYKS